MKSLPNINRLFIELLLLGSIALRLCKTMDCAIGCKRLSNRNNKFVRFPSSNSTGTDIGNFNITNLLLNVNVYFSL